MSRSLHIATLIRGEGGRKHDYVFVYVYDGAFSIKYKTESVYQAECLIIRTRNHGNYLTKPVPANDEIQKKFRGTTVSLACESNYHDIPVPHPVPFPFPTPRMLLVLQPSSSTQHSYFSIMRLFAAVIVFVNVFAVSCCFVYVYTNLNF